MMRSTSVSFTTRTLLATTACLFAATHAAGQSLTLVGNEAAPSGVSEINAYDRFNNNLYSTFGTGLDVYNFGVGSDITAASTIDLSATFGAPGNLDSISSVAIDPLGRGFGVATAIPTANITTVGKAVVFNTATGNVLFSTDVGFHPDMVTFTPGGDVLIANEGERDTDTAQPLGDAPGSITRISFNGNTPATLGIATNNTFDFSSYSLSSSYSSSSFSSSSFSSFSFSFSFSSY